MKFIKYVIFVLIAAVFLWQANRIWNFSTSDRAIEKEIISDAKSIQQYKHVSKKNAVSKIESTEKNMTSEIKKTGHVNTVHNDMIEKEKNNNVKTKEELVSTLRKEGYPKEDIENMTEVFDKISFENKDIDILNDGKSKRYKDISLQLYENLSESGVPDEDIDNMIPILARIRFFERFNQQLSPKASFSLSETLTESGVPVKDIDNMLSIFETSDIKISMDEDKKNELTDNLRDAGVPEEDIEQMKYVLGN